MALFPYIALPAELRLKVYGNLFERLIYPIDESGNRAHKVAHRADFEANTCILRTGRTIREEALPVLESQVAILTSQAKDLSRVPHFLRNAAELRLERFYRHHDYWEDVFDVNEIEAVLPQLRRLKCNLGLTSEPYDVAENIAGSIAEMRGDNDKKLIARIIKSKATDGPMLGPTTSNYQNSSFEMTMRLRSIVFIFRSADTIYAARWVYVICTLKLYEDHFANKTLSQFLWI